MSEAGRKSPWPARIGLCLVSAGAAVWMFVFALEWFHVGAMGFGPQQLILAVGGTLLMVGGVLLWISVRVFYVSLKIAVTLLSLWGVFHLVTGLGSLEVVMESLLKAAGVHERVPPGQFVFRRMANVFAQFYHFPYSYQVKPRPYGIYEKLKLNDLGYRMEEDLADFRGRHPDDRVILLFGGSAAFDVTVPDYRQTIAGRIETLLNADTALLRGERRFKVLNMAVPGSMMLDAMVHYVVFGARLAPEIVICHAGFNDLSAGQMTDTYLLTNYEVTYTSFHEEWSKILFGRRNFLFAPFSRQTEVHRAVNPPEHVVAAYRDRVLQFQRMAQADSALFISGLQPMVSSKKRMSPEEEQRARRDYRLPTLVFSGVPDLYALYLRSDPRQLPAHFVDFHTMFHAYGEEVTLFADVMHYSEDASRMIAESYHRKISELLKRP
ncbi:MAG: hypothetical protein A3G34_01080 [Candidatus Lindowbacteria bacterium RIFCSPLOWO2_12_FULL_62_27]|nr:MAG: hypothetical protein A3G34_01080 [Candidatus Lindowbacteria bacterium RIFCSPLOWO2_12_FULL_62_27]